MEDIRRDFLAYMIYLFHGIAMSTWILSFKFGILSVAKQEIMRAGIYR